MRKDIKYIIRRVIIGLLIAIIFSFINSCDVHALENVEPWADLKIASSGRFYENTNSSGANVNKGYDVYVDTDPYFASPSSSMTLATYGMTITQCGEPIKKDRNYAVMMYWVKNHDKPYIYPGYSSVTNKVGISNNASSVTMNNYTNSWYADNMNNCINGNCYDSFAITFKAVQDGNCFSVAVSTASSTSYTNMFYIGYRLIDYGTHVPTASEIAQAMSSSFDSVVSQQQITNGKLDDVNDNLDDINDTLTDDSVPNSSRVTDLMNSTNTNNTNISALVNFIPATLQVILNGFQNSCSGGYSLGSLYGTELTIPCINPVNYLGSFLWGVIDSILCLCYLIPLCKFLVNKYNDLTSLKNLRWQ